LSDITDRLDSLEKRVEELKDWKKKYEQDEKKWAGEKKELQGLVKDLEGLVAGGRKLAEALRDFLAPYINFPQNVVPRKANSLNVNLEETQLAVDVTHKEEDVNLSTATVTGKVVFCALTELSKDGFSEAELSETLKEHSWNVGHNTLAPTLGGLVRDGYLVKIEGKPAKYRLPTKVKLNVNAGVVQR
jgi:DNA-binding HxlR family transcriptional regulator